MISLDYENHGDEDDGRIRQENGDDDEDEDDDDSEEEEDDGEEDENSDEDEDEEEESVERAERNEINLESRRDEQILQGKFI